MKVVVEYDVNEYEKEYEYKRAGEKELLYGIRKDTYYKNINFSFEYTDIDDIFKDIIENLDDSSEIKVEKIKKIFGGMTNSIYEFENRRCEIYYTDQPPEVLYISIDIFNEPFHYANADELIIPNKVHLIEPEHYYKLLKYEYISNKYRRCN